ncbi:hypothetical protein ACIBBE_42965 [Streptomyces sp. NPDC051644]|uniref:hypothetical protein n=1 Tax=Streptomyces sp. NPDC051644 TaxID=3365666 RepID=UPI0037BC33AB
MITQHLSRPRSTVRAALLVALLAVTAAGCADEPPAGHEKRVDKAAGVASFKITCTRDLWERTSHPEYGDESFDDAKPRKLAGAQGERGLVEVTLTGTQLVDYLGELETDISGGAFANSEDAPMARRMYNAIAPVVDRIQKDTPLTEVPQAVVDDAAVPAGAAPSPASNTTRR